ncbi:MAG: desulfoferrodoxin [Erysipelotrichaceae bacterium]|nr:desulfoferrodoxin [Erysipelotrichaceae bacterium]
MKLMKCLTCGKIVEVLNDSACPTMCCNKPMVELKANTTDGALEKHVPVLSVEGDVLKVVVGEVMHPMTKEHLITSIIAVYGHTVSRVNLTDEDEPVAYFALNGYKGQVEVYEYCNLHGLWKATIEA